MGLTLFAMSQSYSISGNTLITSDKVQIQIGGSLRFVKPYGGKPNFSSIYSEITLRSSSESDLPKGISANQAGKEVKVRKFYERNNGTGGKKVYVIVGGGFLNQAVDIDAALNNGEVLVERPSNNFAQTNSAQGNSTSPKSGLFNTPLRFPWSKKVAPKPNIDSSKLLVQKVPSNSYVDSSKIKPKVFSNSSQNDSNLINQPIIKARSTTESIQPKTQESIEPQVLKAKTSRTENVNSSSAILIPNNTNTPIQTESTTTTYNPSNKDQQINQAASTNSQVNVGVPNPPIQPGSDAAHSVSSLLTLHPVDPPKTEKGIENGNNKEVKGYDKYNKLKQLKELYDQGILNKEEFEAEKKKILSAN